MNKIRIYLPLLLALLLVSSSSLQAREASKKEEKTVNVKEIVFGHIEDAYEWHITTWGETEIVIPLPIILHGADGQWHTFLSSEFHHSPDGSYQGFYISKTRGANEGKIVEKNAKGEELRPLNLSLSKTACGILISSLLLVVSIVSCARWGKRNPHVAPRGFIGFMEMFIMDINDNVIKACIGPKYKKFAPYLLTAFFFIFFNNILGLVPIFPGGANVTGNITITFALAVCTFIITNVFGTKEYYKDIVWPHVPLAIKPIMIPIEIIGVFTKPFALMIRLFANIMAGHTAILCLICIIFITASKGVVMNSSMTAVSFFFALFMNVLELLVAYIQAYVFTMLSAVFIGLAVEEPEK
ncbi:MAG: F0F1 ATP synthase subunit A [Bacteroidaceae bacterium]|nr:F0F1 ATP synthase subunit A [Bacteroidaceae bacterium]